jgi:tetratricopeptide (TPR) repeat protein
VRARLGDFEGALIASDSIIEEDRDAYDLQESGVLRRMMGDLPGALADLNRSLEDGPDDYEVLKHRGYVRFLMKDETGAHLDAQMALKLKPSRVDAISYGTDCLGGTSVEFWTTSLNSSFYFA